MNLLIESGLIEEIAWGTNFAYILNDKTCFLSTEYKVLQSQANGVFVKCMKMLMNGKTELFYLVDSYKPFSSLLNQIDPERFITIVGNLLASIIGVKNNGFLSCNHIDSSFEHIYIDPNTFKVGLVYLPLNKHEFADDSAFENALRSNLIRVISDFPTLTSPGTKQLAADLRNGMLSMEAIYSRIERRGGPALVNASKTMTLISLNAPMRIELKITKPEFTIGKSDTNDGVISFNNKISRTHCKVSGNGQQFSISDLRSLNGTFVNGVQLQPNEHALLKNGDVVRLANCDFRVVIA